MRNKQELKAVVSKTFAWDLVGESGSVEEGQEELLDAMVDVYNKAIDDALELYYNPTSEEGQDTFDKDLLDLKI